MNDPPSARETGHPLNSDGILWRALDRGGYPGFCAADLGGTCVSVLCPEFGSFDPTAVAVYRP